GQLQTRQWKDNSGADRYTTEIVLQNYSSTLVMLDSKNSDSAVVSEANDVFSASPSSGWDNSSATTPSDLDDDIPF
ncbi:MAG: single-stranded DNA-binding protein, partial [Alphaproteobacteria bacterium]|nr:single-stranded DNA-binding protein [Alphaproteobacteria bacterium]